MPLDTYIHTAAGTPSNLMIQQIGDNSIEVSWTAPPTPPRRGYLITLGASNHTVEVYASVSPHRLSIQPGVYETHLMALSEHYHSSVLGPINITVRGKLNTMRKRYQRLISDYWGKAQTKVCPSVHTNKLVILKLGNQTNTERTCFLKGIDWCLVSSKSEEVQISLDRLLSLCA